MSYIKHLTVLTMIFFMGAFLSQNSLAEETSQIIINNEANSSSSNQNTLSNQEIDQKANAITAPALVPSQSDKMRKLRQKQEIDTEDSILQEIEKQRILDERKRFHQIFNKEKQDAVETPTPVSPSVAPSIPSYWFGEKSFLSLGVGLMNYYNVTNVNSTEMPSFLSSFGGYGYEGQMIFDATFLYSVHYLKTPHQNYENIREKLREPGLSMAIKWSFLKGKMKPYVGVTGALIARKWSFVSKDGKALDNNVIKTALRDVAKKQWNLSFNAGLSVGADVILGEKLGLNLDVRYLSNLSGENRKTKFEFLKKVPLLDERDVFLGSLNLKYFFQ